MKPRLILKHDVWMCRSPHPFTLEFQFCAGYGYTPKEAYLEWMARAQVPCPLRIEPTKENHG